MQTTTAPSHDSQGSHMPLNADIHWAWNNPLNILPALLLLLTLLVLIEGIASCI